MPTYSIKDLENLTGINSHTIRMWEQRYILLNPVRTPTNNRVYSDEDLRKLLFVSLLNNNGMKISKIANLTEAEMTEAVLQLSESDDQNIESYKENFKLIMMEMNDAKFEKLFNHLALHIGFEETMLKVFIPMFKKLSFLHQTNSVSTAQLNFITLLYKQKMYVAIDGLIPSEKPESKTFILFLPKMEFLDNELLFCNYMAKKRGFKTLFLGTSIPTEELAGIIKKNPNCYLFSVATLAQTDLTDYYNNVLLLCNEEQKLLLAGSQAGTVKISDPRLIVFQEYTEFQFYLNQL